jgi:galactitol-specific phosphotransferase system IIC component
MNHKTMIGFILGILMAIIINSNCTIWFPLSLIIGIVLAIVDSQKE